MSLRLIKSKGPSIKRYWIWVNLVLRVLSLANPGNEVNMGAITVPLIFVEPLDF